MTHVEYYRITNAIKNARKTGKLPNGITSMDSFYAFEYVAHSYFQGNDAGTNDAEAAKALLDYGIPLRSDGFLSWSIYYKSKLQEQLNMEANND